MFQKGPMPGATPKKDALAVLPKGTVCNLITGMGITGYAVVLPDGRKIASAGNANQAWEKALSWHYRQKHAEPN